jgi:golgi phosphoprotein 3
MAPSSVVAGRARRLIAMLTLAEELLLLGLRDEQGTVASSASVSLRYGVTGALFADLISLGRLGLDDRGRIGVLDVSPTGDDLFDDVLAQVAERKKPRALKDWVLGLGQSQLKVLDRLERRLVDRGILREEEGRILWVFPTHRFPELDHMPELLVRERLRAVVLGGEQPDARTSALLALVRATRLIDEVFAKEERNTAKARLEALARSEASGAAVSDAVKAFEAATMAAVMASVAASSAATSSQ